MSYRNWMLVLGALILVLPGSAFAASFGTASWAHLAPFEAQPSAEMTQLLTDVTPTTTWAWLADGPSAAAAGTPFGSNHAEAAASADVEARASSLWSDTFTITSAWGATGSDLVSFHLMYDGSLDAGPNDGGIAQLTIRALTGVGQNAADPLLPDVIRDTAGVLRTEACQGGSPACSAGRVATSGFLDLDTAFSYGVPFRFSMLLEALAENGGDADFAPSAWLDRIQLPAGAVLRAASGWDYGDLAAHVPEPGTGLLFALGLAGLGRRAASRTARRPGAR